MPTVKSNISKVSVRCNNCDTDDASLITRGVDHEYDNTTDDEFNVVRCNRCGLMYLNPRPDVSELSTIYPGDYYAYLLEEKNREHENKNSPLYRIRKSIYLSRLTKALRLVRSDGGATDDKVLRVLDVGCGDGRALNWYREVNEFTVETYGVDFDETAVSKVRASGHKAYLGRFEEAEIEENYFDLVVATHVIEHVADPKAFARKALSVLKPGGVFLCETPNTDSLDARLFRNRHWGGYHFPRHWVFYTPSSISKMAQELGFEVERIEYNPAPAFWNWTGHSLLKTWGFKKAADYLFPPVDYQKNNFKNFVAAAVFTSIDIVFKLFTGSTSNMAVVLRKPR